MCNRTFYVTIFDLFLSKGAKDYIIPNLEWGFPQMFDFEAPRRTLGRNYIFPFIFTVNIDENHVFYSLFGFIFKGEKHVF